jgi:hypothetical protein
MYNAPFVCLLPILLLLQTAPGNRSSKGSSWVVESSVFEQRKADSDAHDLYDTPKVQYKAVQSQVVGNTGVCTSLYGDSTIPVGGTLPVEVLLYHQHVVSLQYDDVIRAF